MQERMPKAFAKRESHRRALNIHFVVLLVGLAIVFGANRFLTPETFWAHWVALAWGVAFAFHLALFAKGTLATMGVRGAAPPEGDRSSKKS